MDVDLLNNPRDHECVLLAAMGFSNRLIRSRTKLTDGQIAYRLYRKSGGISRTDFRNGNGVFARIVFTQHLGYAEKELIRHLKKNM